MAMRIATVVVATMMLLTGLLGVATADTTNIGMVRLDCEHGVSGCAGMNGTFATDDGGPMSSLTVQVVDMTTGAVMDVTNSGCRLTASADKPNMMQVHCMIDGSELGIDGDIVWIVSVDGVEVWRSAPTPVRCESDDTTTTTSTTLASEPPPPPVDEATTTTSTTVASEAPTDTTEAPPPGETTTTEATLVSPVSPTTPTAEPVVGGPSPTVTVAPVKVQETLPATGLTLGEFTALGAALLGVGAALEGLARRRTRRITQV